MAFTYIIHSPFYSMMKSFYHRLFNAYFNGLSAPLPEGTKYTVLLTWYNIIFEQRIMGSYQAPE